MLMKHANQISVLMEQHAKTNKINFKKDSLFGLIVFVKMDSKDNFAKFKSRVNLTNVKIKQYVKTFRLDLIALVRMDS